MREHGPKCLKLKNWVDGTEIVDTLHQKVKDVSEIQSVLDINFQLEILQPGYQRAHIFGRRVSRPRGEQGGDNFKSMFLRLRALGSVFSLGCLSGDSAYFDTLLSRSQRRRSFWSATGLTKRIGGLWERDWWLCRQKPHSCAQKQFRQENHDDKSFTGLLSRGEVIGIQGNLTFVFNVLGIH